MPLLWILPFGISILANLIIGAIVYFQNYKKTSNRLFTGVILSVLGWEITLLLFYWLTDPKAVYHLGQINFAFAELIALFIFLFFIYFPTRSLSFPKKVIQGSIIFTILLLILTISTPYIVKDEIIVGPLDRVTVYGELYWLFIIQFLGLFIMGIIIGYIKLKKISGVERLQIKYVLLGLVLAISLGSITNILLPLLISNYAYQPLGVVSTLFMIAFTSYAIIRHRLMDIRLVVARTISYTLLVLLLGISYSAVLFFIGNYLFPSELSNNQFIISTFLALVLAYTFQPLRSYLEKATDKIFFQARYDTHDLLAKFSHLMSTTINLDNLITKTLQIILDIMRVSGGGIILLNGSAPHQSYVNFEFKNKLTRKQIIYFASKRTKIFIKDEMAFSKVRNWMSENNIAVVIPLSTRESDIGMLVLGNKSSGDMYSDQDIKVFQILAPELSIAIQNAKAFLEISKFNIKLKDEVRRKTAKLRQANKKLKLADRIKDEFLSIASHELRTPMTAIKSYLWMTLNKSNNQDHLSPRSAQYLKRAYVSTERLLSLINDMLNVSRIEAGHIEIQIAEMDLAQLVKQSIEDLKPKIVEKKLSINFPDEQPQVVSADQDKIHQVLINIIGNAVKFTPPGGQISVAFRNDDTYVYCTISDTGKGIAQNDIPRLFTKFGRLDQSFVSVAESGGTGLGLFICNQIITRHGGKIYVESKLGQGSSFTFSLPKF